MELETEGEDISRATFAVPIVVRPGHGWHCSLKRRVGSSSPPCSSTNLSSSGNSRLSMQNKQLGYSDFTNPGYPGLLPIQIRPKTHPGYYLHSQM